MASALYHDPPLISSLRYFPTQTVITVWTSLIKAIIAPHNWLQWLHLSHLRENNSGLQIPGSLHVTNDLYNLSLRSDYKGKDRLTVGNGQALSISSIGSSTVHTSGSFKLNNVLHVPHISSNRLSVHQFSKDNDCVFIFDYSASLYRIVDRRGSFSRVAVRMACIHSLHLHLLLLLLLPLSSSEKGHQSMSGISTLDTPLLLLYNISWKLYQKTALLLYLSVNNVNLEKAINFIYYILFLFHLGHLSLCTVMYGGLPQLYQWVVLDTTWYLLMTSLNTLGSFLLCANLMSFLPFCISNWKDAWFFNKMSLNWWRWRVHECSKKTKKKRKEKKITKSI